MYTCWLFLTRLSTHKLFCYTTSIHFLLSFKPWSDLCKLTYRLSVLLYIRCLACFSENISSVVAPVIPMTITWLKVWGSCQCGQTSSDLLGQLADHPLARLSSVHVPAFNYLASGKIQVRQLAELCNTWSDNPLNLVMSSHCHGNASLHSQLN